MKVSFPAIVILCFLATSCADTAESKMAEGDHIMKEALSQNPALFEMVPTGGKDVGDKIDQAAGLYLDAVRLSASDSRPYQGLALAYRMRGHGVLSKKVLDIAVGKFPDDQDLLKMQGDFRFRCLKYIEKFGTRNNLDDHELMGLVYAYDVIGDQRKSEALLSRARVEFRDSSQIDFYKKEKQEASVLSLP